MMFTASTHRTRTGLAAAACLLVAGFTSSASASSINYGDFSDIPPGSVMYLDVTETANTPGDIPPLYGAPSVLGNLLDFDSAGFNATAQDGSSDITDGQLNFTLMADQGQYITDFFISESGDYSLLGTGTTATNITYALAVTSVKVLEVDGVELDTPVTLAPLNVSGGDDLGSGTDALTPWSLQLAYSLDTALQNTNVLFRAGVTKVEIAVNNTLAAISEDLSIASVSKKDFTISTNTEDIPEPAAGLMIGLGLGLAGLRRRR